MYIVMHIVMLMLTLMHHAHMPRAGKNARHLASLARAEAGRGLQRAGRGGKRGGGLAVQESKQIAVLGLTELNNHVINKSRSVTLT